MSTRAWTRRDKIKGGVGAVAFAAVIFVGSLTGAHIKSDRQKDDAIKQFRQSTPADQIAILETQKLHLLQQKQQLERKLHLFNDRVRDRDAEQRKGER
ncbi:hypothetical protein DCS_04035 [Drechmeria coniospora]|uniref:Uncharacterized protein n=1 Tax=Drechmeria coniospora TaxID=98403 RepID=A0A151GIW4_DRECN|nr:hypothetical protein DCS_04035 [Drechmeria coniospora]KYK57028.1 hypothetical protein DCS_04035 [Drechmeria coniospora]ODA78935.1 hypothetical protein RJ55_04525 [Drechmeria coniospora]